MEGEEGGVSNRLKKLAGSKPVSGSGEVDYKTKAGTAWSHSYLNQKPWHPLSYPNQRRKWIAEQIHSERERRAEEIAREYAQEQEFFRQTALVSKKDKEKIETMQAVSFMYVRPPGYNPESAKAAEIEEQSKKEGQDIQPADATKPDTVAAREKKMRPKDVFGRPLPTEEEFEILKNAPRLETGLPARVKPFGVEVRNVRCLRCGNYGHQSGDRECPLKDIVMPNEESRLKRDDPLTAIMAHVDPSEPLKWELKRKPGNFSPPRGGFKPDDPNQQIVAEEIFDEYGGFLSNDNIPELLTNFSTKPKKKKTKKKSKHKRHTSISTDLRISDEDRSTPFLDEEGDKSKEKHKKKKRHKKQYHSKSNSSDDSESDRHRRKSRHKKYHSSDDSDYDEYHRSKKSRQKNPSEDSDSDGYHLSKGKRHKNSYQSDDSESHRQHKNKRSKRRHSFSDEADEHPSSGRGRHRHSLSSEDSDFDRHQRSEKSRQNHSFTSVDESDRHHRNEKSKHKQYYSTSYEDSYFDKRGRFRQYGHR